MTAPDLQLTWQNGVPEGFAVSDWPVATVLEGACPWHPTAGRMEPVERTAAGVTRTWARCSVCCLLWMAGENELGLPRICVLSDGGKEAWAAVWDDVGPVTAALLEYRASRVVP